MTLLNFKAFFESDEYDSYGDVECAGCHKKFFEEKIDDRDTIYLCDDCESEGWWVDPSGGLHPPDNDEFEDPTSMYEKLYENYDKKVKWHDSDKLVDTNDKLGV